MDWHAEPHPVDPVIAEAVDHINELLPTRYLEPLITARDCELAGFNLADVMAAYRAEAR